MRQLYKKSQGFQSIDRLWLPLLLGLVVTIAVLGLWRQLLVQEQLHIEQLVQQKVGAVEAELSRELSNRILILQRMANRWQVSGGLTQGLWEADAASYIQDSYAYQAIEWVDPSQRVRWIVPLQGNEAAQNLDLTQDSRRQVTLRVARDLRQPLLTRTISLVQGEKGFLACVPLFIEARDGAADRFDGFIVGVFQFQTLFDSILKTSPQYQIQIFDKGELIYSQGEVPASTPPKTTIIQAYGADWQVEIFPTSVLIAQERSLLPNVVLLGGLGAAWVLALMVDLAQRSEYQARRAKKINGQLQEEILHRQQVEASLRESEERWQLVLRGNNDGIWDWNVQTNEVFFSSRWKEMLGFADGEISNCLEEWSKRVHPDDLGWVTEVIQDHFAKKTPFYISEHRVQCKDGSFKWILDRGQALWDEAGNVIRMTGSHTDITERKQAEATLWQSEKKYRQLIEHLNAGFVVHAPDTRIVQCNATACHLLGLSMDQMLGKVMIELNCHFIRDDGTPMPPEEYPVNRVLRTKDELENYVIGISRGSQPPVWVLVTVFPELDAQGQLKHILVTFIDISKLKQAEIAIAQLGAIVESSEDAIIGKTPEGIITSWNAGAERIFGYKTQEIIGRSILTLIPEADWSEEKRILARIGNGEHIANYDTQRIRKDGTRIDISVSVSPIRDTWGKPIGASTIIRDISERARLEAERKAAEAALRQSESTLRSFFNSETMLMGIVELHDNDILHLSDNQTTANFFGTTPEAMQNRFASEMGVPQSHLQQWLDSYREAARTQAPVRFEYSHATPIGQYWLAASVCQIASSSNYLPRFSYIVEDITERKRAESTRKQAEEELRHQKGMFQAIVDHIPVMIALFNERGQIELINPELEQGLGWSLEEWHQQDILAKCYPEPVYRQNVLDHMLAATGNWRDFTSLDANGQRLEVSWANVQLSGGRFLGIGQDISDRKHKEIALRQAMEAAEAANLAKSMFLANMSHELRTPLNVILGFAQVMMHSASLTQSQREDLQTIRRSGDHLLSLINDVLDLSKIEAGHCTVETTGLDLIELLHSLRSMFAERAISKGIQISFNIAPEVPQFILTDAPKLRQILLNLLSNAIKFTKEGHVILQVKVKDGEGTYSASNFRQSQSSQQHPVTIEFTVSDTGVGIAPEEIDTIFDAFVQADAGRKLTGGTGLGLTISRKLLEIMGGEIAVDSTLGKGSTFIFTLPAYPTSGVDIPPEQNNRLIIGLAPGQFQRRILVVDDQLENRLLMVRLLTPLGLEVREASNGQEAVQIWRDWQPELTWMDIRMPVLDGYEATKQIRAMEQNQASIIIALTAQASQSDRSLALTAGCNDYISKPFREETLFLKMAEYLDLKYVYAELSDLTEPQTSQERTSAMLLSLPDLARLPEAWVKDLEKAAVCGDDRAILNLVEQLSSELTPLALHLTELANHYEFEQILQLINSHFSTST